MINICFSMLYLCMSNNEFILDGLILVGYVFGDGDFFGVIGFYFVFIYELV